MFGRGDPKVEKTMKLPNGKSHMEQTPEISAQVPNVTAQVPSNEGPSEVARASKASSPRSAPASEDKQERSAPAPEDRQERSASASQGKYEGHVLIGEGVKIVGEIRDCRQIEIHGTVEGDLEAEELIVHANGLLTGNVRTDRAQVHGSIDGDMSVKHLLDVKSKGSVAGTTQYGELSIETGGRIVGTLDDRSAKNDKLVGTKSLGAPTDTIHTESKTAKA